MFVVAYCKSNADKTVGKKTNKKAHCANVKNEAYRRGEYYSPAHRMCSSTKTIVRWTSLKTGVEGACRCQWQMKAST